MGRPQRPRRSVHAVPGASERFLAKAPSLAADEVFIDLEDGSADKELARMQAIAALRTQSFRAPTVAVRINGTDTPHYYRDLIEIVEQAGARLHAVIVPKVRTPGDIEMTAKLLTQIERACNLEAGAIGLEAQIEDAAGLIAVDAIAAASTRLEALIFGPGDYSAAVGIPVTTIGGTPEGYPGDHLNYVYTRILVAARAAGLEAIDGPYARIGDTDGLVTRARLVRALGYDGKWTIHPDQIAPVNEVFAPSREQFERAAAMLDALGRSPGSARFEGEMIDEANRRMAERIVRTGRAAGLDQ
jgi:citrate lyase subunit beta / citryl-CoA lyase